MNPLCIDLFCGLGGWSSGFLDAGYDCRGYDVEAHDYGSGGYPGELVLRDVRSIHGSEFKDAACIVASPPCQEPSYRAMPWKQAKALTPAEAGLAEPSWWAKTESEMSKAELVAWRLWQEKYPKPAPELFIELFNACFRIQREACEAAGHYIPMVVENVRGAQPWVGRAKANFGSFYLWGDVGMVGNRVVCVVNGKLLGYGVRPMKAAKVPGFRFDGSGGSFQSAAVKVSGMNWSDRDRPAQGFNVTAAQRYREGVKQPGIGGVRENGKGDAWFQDGAARHVSKSDSRKAASALIAKIPFTLSSHIARAFKP